MQAGWSQGALWQRGEPDCQQCCSRNGEQRCLVVPVTLLVCFASNSDFITSTPQDEGVAFLLTESQVVDEKMLVLVNDLLASGEVPGGLAVH